MIREVSRRRRPFSEKEKKGGAMNVAERMRMGGTN